MSDLSSALKSLRAARGTALAAITTLALGTGANTGVLAVAYGVLLRPLPFESPERLVVVDTAPRAESGVRYGMPLSSVDEWQRRLQSAEGLAAFTTAELIVRGAGESDSVHSLLVTGGFFDVLAARPAAGRPFDDSRASSVVVSERYARRLEASGGVLGRSLTIGDAAFQVAAVMPASFAFPDENVDLWVPAQAVGALHITGTNDARSYRLIARMRPGATIAQVLEDAERARHDISPGQTGVVATVDPLADEMTGSARPVLAAFLAAAALLLLVACANVATLLVGRAVAQRRERAVRVALGASPARLVRGALAESLLLAAAGSLVGVALAEAGLRAFMHAVSGSLPRAGAVALDLPVLAASTGIALLVTTLCGLAPAVAVFRTDFAPAFRQTTTSAPGARARAPLVVLQVALAIVLLTGAGLFARTVVGLLRGHGGVESAHVLTSRLMLTDGTRFNAAGRQHFVDDLLQRVRALPGVTSAGLGSNLPPRRSQLAFSVRMVNDTGRDSAYTLDLVAATSGYLQALGVRLVQGRLFEEHDDQSGEPVALLSESAARDLSWGGSPLDRQLVFAMPTAAGPRVKPRVVGIVSDVHYTGLDRAARDNVYVLWHNLPTGTSYLVARTTGEPANLAPAVVRTLRDLDPGLPLLDVRSLDAEMNLAIAGRELRLWLVAVFALLAFAVAIVGLGAALGRSVVERRKELAIRSALGETPAGAMALIVRRGAVLILAGLALGLGAAAASGRWLSALLYGVSPYDPATYAVVALAVVTASALACYLPARRAARVDPLELLRGE